MADNMVRHGPGQFRLPHEHSPHAIFPQDLGLRLGVGPKQDLQAGIEGPSRFYHPADLGGVGRRDDQRRRPRDVRLDEHRRLGCVARHGQDPPCPDPGHSTHTRFLPPRWLFDTPEGRIPSRDSPLAGV